MFVRFSAGPASSVPVAKLATLWLASRRASGVKVQTPKKANLPSVKSSVEKTWLAENFFRATRV